MKKITDDKIIFDADRDNKGLGIPAIEILNLLNSIQEEEKCS